VFLEATFRMEYGSYVDIVFIKNYVMSVERRQDDYECIYGADTAECSLPILTNFARCNTLSGAFLFFCFPLFAHS
jgi:hypothetical protein